MMEQFENKDISDQVVNPEQIGDIEATIDAQKKRELELAKNTFQEQIVELKEEITNDMVKVEVASNTSKESTTTGWWPVAFKRNASVQSRLQELAPNSPANAQREIAYGNVLNAIKDLPFGLDKVFANA